MNASYTNPACELDSSYCKFGSETLIGLLDSLEGNISGAIQNKDVECVHKSRVTTRRIRAALPLFRFCFPDKQYNIWLKQIKYVTRLLGEARDLDVQILFIQDYMESVSLEEQKYIDMLLKNRKNQRACLQSSVASGLKKLTDSHIVPDFSNYCQQIISQQATAFDPNQVLEKSRWHISFRLDDFLALEKYVHSINEDLKHHEMRIAAKKLRYTMEFFAPLYPNKLKDEIETIKQYQDILGEKHDSEVWISYLPQFIQEAESKRKRIDREKFERSLNNFLAYLKDQRRQHYEQFAALWAKNAKNGFFNRIRTTTEAETLASPKRLEQVLTSKNVKIAILSDIHGNLHALERVFEDAEQRGINIFFNAGDSIGFGACPNEVLQLLCEKNVQSILGNYDIEVIDGKTDAKGEKKVAWKFAKNELKKSCECYLHALPRELRFEVAGKKILITHGSPQSIEEHIYHDTPTQHLQTLADFAKADIIIVGHSHEQLSKQANGVWFINPGSVGRPADRNPQTGYAIISFDPFTVELIRLDYTVEDAANALRKKNLPESFAQMLLRGVSLDEIINENDDKANYMVDNCKEAIEASVQAADRFWPDQEHYKQVTNVALGLFDRLTKLHKLGTRERCWLECASILHDVGLSKSQGKHHKESCQLILNNTRLPFPSLDRQIIASIARYHRKGLPKRKHYNLATVNKKNMYKVCILAGLLRVADGLDYTHEAKVKVTGVKIGAKKVSVECISSGDFGLEEQAFNKKKNLFEKAIGEKMSLVWKK